LDGIGIGIIALIFRMDLVLAAQKGFGFGVAFAFHMTDFNLGMSIAFHST